MNKNKNLKYLSFLINVCISQYKLHLRFAFALLIDCSPIMSDISASYQTLQDFDWSMRVSTNQLLSCVLS